MVERSPKSLTSREKATTTTLHCNGVTAACVDSSHVQGMLKVLFFFLIISICSRNQYLSHAKRPNSTFLTSEDFKAGDVRTHKY